MVCPGGPIESQQVLDLVAHLVDKSLLTAVESGDGIRYRLLETLRQYGRDRLTQRGETEAARKRHAGYFRKLAEDALPHLRGRDENLWLDRLETDHDNFRQALRWTIDANEGDLAQGLAGTLYRFWMIRSHVDEGRTWLDQVLALESGGGESLTRALLGAGSLALTHNDMPLARHYLEAAVSGFRKVRDVRLLPAAMHNLGRVLLAMADYPAATSLVEEELVLAEDLGDSDSAAFALATLGELALARGDHAAASGRFAEAVTKARSTGSTELLGNTLAVIVLSLLVVDDLDAADGYAAELHALGRSEHAPGRHTVLTGMVLARRGHLDQGLSMIRDGIASFRTLRGYARLAWVLRGAFEEWAGVELARGEHERAATLLGGADRLTGGSESLPHEHEAADRRRRKVREEMSPEAYEKAWQRGMTFSFDELLDFAIDS